MLLPFRNPVTPALRSWMVWAGRIISCCRCSWSSPVPAGSCTDAPTYVAEFARIGWPTSALPRWPSCNSRRFMLLYVIPRTSVLGAILLTGYLGGAIGVIRPHRRIRAATGAADHRTPRVARDFPARTAVACLAAVPAALATAIISTAPDPDAAASGRTSHPCARIPAHNNPGRVRANMEVVE